MINLQTVFVANGAAIILLLILLVSSGRTLHCRMVDDKIFYIMVISTILQCLVETGTFCVDGNTKPGYYELSLFLNSFLYINNIFFAFMWTVYADFKLFGSINRIRRIYPFVAIPAILISLGSIVNLFTPVFFSISEENVYQRTPAYVIAFLMTYMYLAYGVAIIYKYKNKVNKYLFLPAILFMIPILLGSILQYFFYGLSLVWIGAAIALVSLYINVQNEVSYVDSLSGLFTRQYMNRYLDVEMKRTESKKKIAGIMMDIDHFKSINDTFGHLVGDDAILSAGKILRSCVSANDLAVRFAGDEFIIIQLIETEEEVQDTIKKIQKRTEDFNSLGKKPYHIQFSIGYSLYNWTDDSVNGFLGRMDMAMYTDKKSKKGM